MVEVDAIALTVGKVRNATFTILNASLLIAPNMGSVVKGYASVILVGPVNIAKHVSILYFVAFFLLLDVSLLNFFATLFWFLTARA